MSYIVKLFCMFWLLLVVNIIHAQDIHYSQYYLSPVNINPALSGNFNGDFRLIGNHRTQWSTVSIPFVTFSGSYEFSFLKKQNFKFSSAVLFNTDKAGDSKFTNNHIGLSLAYHKTLSNYLNQMLSLGMLIKYAQLSFDYNELMFNNQWDGTMYNSNLGSQEFFATENFGYLDLAIGGNWQYTYDEKRYFNTGMSIYHINAPKQTFFNNTKERLSPRFTFYSNNVFRFHESIFFIPGFILHRQGRYSELILGSTAKFNMKETKKDKVSVYFGAFYRFGDAVILTTKIDMNTLRLGLSYDFNVSGLVPASKGQGAIEIALIYIIKIPELPDRFEKYQICPVFI